MTQHTTNSRELAFGDISVTVREMSVLQVRGWLSEEDADGGLIDVAFLPECSLSDLKRMSTLTDEQLNTLRPSQLREVLTVCKELNPDFFDFLRRVKEWSGAAKPLRPDQPGSMHTRHGATWPCACVVLPMGFLSSGAEGC